MRYCYSVDIMLELGKSYLGWIWFFFSKYLIFELSVCKWVLNMFFFSLNVVMDFIKWYGYEKNLWVENVI